MHYQAHNVDTIREGVEKYGVAGGARVMMSNEYLHAKEAVESGIYMTYWCEKKKSECFRLGSKSKCFCGHLQNEHNKNIGTKKIDTKCLNCPCKAFSYVPTRPEEVGMWWLPRRKEFDVRTWRAKCKCKHSHEEHAPTRPFRCKACGNCQDFHCDFACITCDCAWEDHMVLYETEQERKMEKKPIGQAYYPLADHADIQDMVFNPALANKPTPFMRPRPKDAPQLQKRPEITSKPSMKQIGFEESKMNKDFGFDSGNTLDPSLDKYDPGQKVIMKGNAREGYGVGKPSVGNLGGPKTTTSTLKSGTGMNKVSSVNKVGTGSMIL